MNEAIENQQTTHWQIVKKIIFLALPMAMVQLISAASGFLSMTMVAKLGHEVLAASALIFATQITTVVVCMSFLLTLSLFVGRAYGAKDYPLIGNYVQQCWTFAIIFSIPVSILLWHISPLLILFGQSPAIASIVQTFFHAYVWGIAPLMIFVCNQQLCYGINKQKFAMLASALGTLIFLISAYALILGKLHMPKLGVTGLGYAMVIQIWFIFLLTTLYFYFNKQFKPFDLFNYRVHKNFGSITQMLKVGWPISLQMSGEMLSFFANSTMVGWISINALAAYQVVGQYLFLIIVPIFSIAQTSGILVGQAYGGKKFHEIKKLGHMCLLVVLIMTLIVAAIFIIFPRSLAVLYLDVHNPNYMDTLHLVILLFVIVAISQIFDALRNVATGALRGLYDTKFSMIAGLVAIWLVGIPASYLLAFTFHWGVTGIASGGLIGMLIGSAAVLWRWHKLSKAY